MKVAAAGANRMADCNVCAALKGSTAWADLTVYEDDLVLLGHTPPSSEDLSDAYPGHLLLVPQRHVESQAELEPREAERVGLWLARGSRLLETSYSAEHVYVMRLGDSWPHLHFHLLPRYRGTPSEYRGLEIRDWPGIKRCGRGEVAAIAARLKIDANSFSDPANNLRESRP